MIMIETNVEIDIKVSIITKELIVSIAFVEIL